MLIFLNCATSINNTKSPEYLPVSSYQMISKQPLQGHVWGRVVPWRCTPQKPCNWCKEIVRCWKEKLSHSPDIEKSRQGTTNAVPFRQVRTKIFTKSCGTFPLADWFNLELKWPVIQTQPSLECFCRNTQGEVEWTSVRPLTTKFDVFWSVNACWDEGKKRIIKCKETMNSKLYKTAGT